MRKSKPKRTDGQIRDALKKEAREQGMNPNEAYNRFFRELFLAELMSRDQGWVLKGGTNLYCQIPGARHTRDLDLYRQDDPTSFRRAAAELVETMDEAKIGPYRFKVSIPKGETVNGAIDNISLKTGCRTLDLTFHRLSLLWSGKKITGFPHLVEIHGARRVPRYFLTRGAISCSKWRRRIADDIEPAYTRTFF